MATANVKTYSNARAILGASANVSGRGGTVTIVDSADVNDLVIDGPCTVAAQLAGTIATLDLDHPNAVLDVTGHPGSITITSWQLKRGVVRDTNGILSWGSGTGLNRGVMTFAEQ